MYILGIHIGHNRSACLLKDGRIIIAVAEERLDRIKKSLSFRIPPMRAIVYCLSSIGLTIDELDLIVTDFIHVGTLKSMLPVKDKSKIKAIPHPAHHLAHAYSAYFCSPFNESAILVADGNGSLLSPRHGEAESGFYAKGKNIGLVFRTQTILDSEKIAARDNCYSLGYMYAFISRVLGFILPGGIEEPGKTMGLAAFGKQVNSWPALIEDRPAGSLSLKRFIQWVLAHKIGEMKNGRLIPRARPFKERLSQFHKDLAYKAQEELEKGLMHRVNHLYAETKCKNLCLSGGVALNSIANKKILDNGPFKNIFIQPSPEDDGVAIGHAMYGWHKIANERKRFPIKNAYFGREYARGEIQAALAEHNILKKPLSKDKLIRQTAKFIAEGKIVGWFQGASEFGPRALGHRSILADPRNPKTKELLNKKVKHREGFRPYAPSVILEFAEEYFDLPCPSPFMLLVAQVKKDKHKNIPAVIHIDGTARVQTVTRKDNGIFYDLLKEFYRIRKIPLILNTSFNTIGKPIIETPRDALEVFFNTEMDILVLGNFLLQRKDKERITG